MCVPEHQLWLGTHKLANMYRIPSITKPRLNKQVLEKRSFAQRAGKTLHLINQQFQHIKLSKKHHCHLHAMLSSITV